MRTIKKPPAVLRLDIKALPQKDRTNWGSRRKAVLVFKRNLRSWLLKRQKARCAYCSLKVGLDVQRSYHLDHFVPKNATNGKKEWTFEVLNLILCCEACNTKRKKQKNPLTKSGNSYKSSEFLMFHPYLDDARRHFRGGYRGGLDVPAVVKGLTPEAVETIKRFNLANGNFLRLWQNEYFDEKQERQERQLPPSIRVRYREIRLEISPSSRASRR